MKAVALLVAALCAAMAAGELQLGTIVRTRDFIREVVSARGPDGGRHGRRKGSALVLGACQFFFSSS